MNKKQKKLKQNQNIDCLFTKDIISIDDKKNKQYLDDFAYQQYLSKLNNKGCDFYE